MSSAPLPRLTEIGGHRLEGELGRGSFAVVHAATSPDGRRVAVKLFGRSASEQLPLDRLRAQHASLVGLPPHPDVVGEIASGAHDGRLFFVRERVEGDSLAALLRARAPFPWREAAAIATSLCAGLVHLHDHRVLHRDLKPTNVLVARGGEARLVDHGFELDGFRVPRLLAGALYGTPLYMPPEQIGLLGPASYAPASDVYGAAAILYELLCGRPPLLARTVDELLAAIRAGRPQDPRAFVADVPAPLAELCLAALSRDPARRPATANDLASELARAIDASAREVPATRPQAESRLGTFATDPYRITAVIGQGGMGLVFRAVAPDGREVAIKVLRREDKPALDRFAREARLQAEVGAEGGFVPLLDARDGADGPFLVLPYLPGGTLRDRFATGPLSVDETVALGRALASAMGRAHARGIIHRDLKPENVLFDGDGRPLIADLGLAKHFQLASSGQSIALSRTGELHGTFGYMPPEQMRDAKRALPASDVFSLGAILYEALAGRPAFSAANPIELGVAVMLGECQPLDEVRPDAPPWLRSAVHQALARDPSARPKDGAALAAALGPSSRAPRGAFVALAIALAAGAAALARSRPAPETPPAAVTTAAPARPARARPTARRTVLDTFDDPSSLRGWRVEISAGAPDAGGRIEHGTDRNGRGSLVLAYDYSGATARQVSAARDLAAPARGAVLTAWVRSDPSVLVAFFIRDPVGNEHFHWIQRPRWSGAKDWYPAVVALDAERGRDSPRPRGPGSVLSVWLVTVNRLDGRNVGSVELDDLALEDELLASLDDGAKPLELAPGPRLLENVGATLAPSELGDRKAVEAVAESGLRAVRVPARWNGLGGHDSSEDFVGLDELVGTIRIAERLGLSTLVSLDPGELPDLVRESERRDAAFIRWVEAVAGALRATRCRRFEVPERCDRPELWPTDASFAAFTSSVQGALRRALPDARVESGPIGPGETRRLLALGGRDPRLDAIGIEPGGPWVGLGASDVLNLKALVPNAPLAVKGWSAKFHDAARIREVRIPSVLRPGEPATLEVEVLNSGTTTWGPMHRLAAIGDGNAVAMPFLAAAAGRPSQSKVEGARVLLPGPVAPGEVHRFSFAVVAPRREGTYELRFRMVHELQRWVGDTLVAPVTVSATTEAPPEPASPRDPGPPDLPVAAEVVRGILALRASGLSTAWLPAGALRPGSTLARALTRLEVMTSERRVAAVIPTRNGAVTCLSLAGSKDDLTAAWCDESGAQASLSIDGPATARDVLGEAVPVEEIDGRREVRLEPGPVFIERKR